MGIFSPAATDGEWLPAKGDIVKLKEPLPDIWEDLKDVEGHVSVVEHRRPPHPVQPTGRLEVIIHDRTLCAAKERFEFIRKG